MPVAVWHNLVWGKTKVPMFFETLEVLIICVSYSLNQPADMCCKVHRLLYFVADRLTYMNSIAMQYELNAGAILLLAVFFFNAAAQLDF